MGRSKQPRSPSLASSRKKLEIARYRIVDVDGALHINDCLKDCKVPDGSRLNTSTCASASRRLFWFSSMKLHYRDQISLPFSLVTELLSSTTPIYSRVRI